MWLCRVWIASRSSGSLRMTITSARYPTGLALQFGLRGSMSVHRRYPVVCGLTSERSWYPRPERCSPTGRASTKSCGVRFGIALVRLMTTCCPAHSTGQSVDTTAPSSPKGHPCQPVVRPRAFGIIGTERAHETRRMAVGVRGAARDQTVGLARGGGPRRSFASGQRRHRPIHRVCPGEESLRPTGCFSRDMGTRPGTVQAP